ncbi:MAG: hypothetical protein M3O50_01215 [Myxococcota bacterium]|nr:hypothetical protein [Myxococcota bacterium]
MTFSNVPDPESDPFRRPWLTTMLGLTIIGYALYWLVHPSTYGFAFGFGLLGRVLQRLERQCGKWPVGIFFAITGLSVLSIGLWGLIRKRPSRP